MPSYDNDPLRYWARLEPRPRAVEFDQSLQAGIADPLWMLTRQWQFGEFHGEDAGSAIMATLAHRASPVAQVRVGGGQAEPYNPNAPLEARVERLDVDFPAPVRAHIGRHLVALLTARLKDDAATTQIRTVLAGLYPLHPAGGAGADPANPVTRARSAGSGLGGRVHQALAGRALDGVAVATALPPRPEPSDLAPEVVDLVNTYGPDLLAALTEFRDWYGRLYSQPEPSEPSGWSDERLEYDFGVTVAHDKQAGLELVGQTSVTGRVDWYSFDVAGQGELAGSQAPQWSVTGVIPAPVTFAGMPHPRWWQFEDGAVSLGHLQADATDLAKMLAMNFALVYGNDWLSVPLPQTIGTLAEIGGIVVTDVFSRRTLVRAATGAAGDDWSRWDLFSLSSREPGLPALGQHLFLPPVTPSPVTGPVIEEAAFVRDEAANLVWAVETIIPNGLGGGRDGGDAARRLAKALYPTVESTTAATGLRYLLGTGVPENWIPFTPVHTGENHRSIRLQRAWLPRPVPTNPRIRPVTTILRAGLTPDDEAAERSFVNEEEVPRAGVRVRAMMQRSRWTDGSIVVWHGRQRRSGRGEGSSGLRFDVLELDEGGVADPG